MFFQPGISVTKTISVADVFDSDSEDVHSQSSTSFQKLQSDLKIDLPANNWNTLFTCPTLPQHYFYLSVQTFMVSHLVLLPFQRFNSLNFSRKLGRTELTPTDLHQHKRTIFSLIFHWNNLHNFTHFLLSGSWRELLQSLCARSDSQNRSPFLQTTCHPLHSCWILGNIL